MFILTLVATLLHSPWPAFLQVSLHLQLKISATVHMLLSIIIIMSYYCLLFLCNDRFVRVFIAFLSGCKVATYVHYPTISTVRFNYLNSKNRKSVSYRPVKPLVFSTLRKTLSYPSVPLYPGHAFPGMGASANL